jgi:hypothetical protein
MVVKPTLARGFNYKDMHWPIFPRFTLAAPWLSAICAAPNERGIASGATVEFKSTSTSSRRRHEKFVTNP